MISVVVRKEYEQPDEMLKSDEQHIYKFVLYLQVDHINVNSERVM